MIDVKDIWAYFSDPPEDQQQYVNRTLYRLLEGPASNGVYLKGCAFYSALRDLVEANTERLPEFVQEKLACDDTETVAHLMYLVLSGWRDHYFKVLVPHHFSKARDWRDYGETSIDYTTSYDESEILYEADIRVYRATSFEMTNITMVSDYKQKDAKRVYLKGQRAVRICDLDFDKFRSVNMRAENMGEIFWIPSGPGSIREGQPMPLKRSDVLEEISCRRACRVIDSATWQRALKHMQLSPWPDSKRVSGRGIRAEIEFYIR
ncbi:hypothetical protein ASPBRDRAFT_37301 [Aspergillus brasiliensis CBS 101740]|uniref:Uncharacterized protein n=1 Tax=Aspergillus brasiliensis (strain CBS 101740 / IMI 381727 / IBT 21946) TaxID=767769 RepID=A0A1L9V2F0_ASPBC|nr:hypothetical protein ASPBRDRAFT_37301 [Aspergillus brasiliensis CBS 101740]